MIRPATETLKEHSGTSALVVAAFAFAMVVPAAGWFFASAAERLAGRWLAQYRPVVYLAKDVREGESGELADQIERWGDVTETTVRTSEEAYRNAASRLGEDRLTEVGVRPDMFPESIVVEPNGMAADADLVARLESLTTESHVEAVDVPSTRVSTVLARVATARIGVIVLTVVLVGLGLALVADHLLDLRRRERRELSLLERFGASVHQLRRATIVRGAILGIWAGLAAAGILLAMALYWRTIETSLLGGGPAATPRNWLVVAAPVVLGPLGGAAVGAWAARRPLQRETEQIQGLESLLDYE